MKNFFSFSIGLFLCTTLVGLQAKAQSYNNLDVLDPIYLSTEVAYPLYNPTASTISAGVIVSQDSVYNLQGSIIIQDEILYRGEVDVPPNDTLFIYADLHFSHQDYSGLILYESCPEKSDLLNSTTAINVGNAAEIFTIFPNPASDFIELMSKQEIRGKVDLELLDARGNVVLYRQWMLPGKMHLEIAHLPRGLYHLSLTTDQQRYLTKVSIQ